jgi:hypothetical protein
MIEIANQQGRKTDMKKIYLMTMLAVLAAPLFGLMAAGDEARKHEGQTQLSGFGFYDKIDLSDVKEWSAGGGAGYYLTDIFQIGIEGSAYHNEVQVGYAGAAASTVAGSKAVYYYPPAPAATPSSSSASSRTPASSSSAASSAAYSYSTVKATYWHADVCLTAVMPTDKSNPFEPYLGVLAGTYWDDYNRDYSFLFGGKAGINTYVSDQVGILTEYRYMRNTKADKNEQYVEFGIFYLFK